MPAGLSGAGWLAISMEATMGTYQDPSTAGTIWVPILSEGLKYTEDKYFSEQIRQSTIESEVAQSYYHVEGPIVMEADPQFLPYFLHCSRHTIVKTDTAGVSPFTYTYTPSNAGSASIAAAGQGPRTASITVVRNGQGFGYAGCVVGGMEWTIESGVLRVTFNVLGLSEEEPADLDTPVWVASKLLGADAHDIFVDTAGTAPTFATPDENFNGITVNINYNAEAQNRISSDRSAAYISYGKTEANYNTQLDFIDRTEYDNFIAATTRAVRLESKILGAGDTTWADVDYGVRIDFNRSTYETYDVSLEGLADLIMAEVTGRALGIAGGSPIKIAVKTTTDIDDIA